MLFYSTNELYCQTLLSILKSGTATQQKLITVSPNNELDQLMNQLTSKALQSFLKICSFIIEEKPKDIISQTEHPNQYLV